MLNTQTHVAPDRGEDAPEPRKQNRRTGRFSTSELTCSLGRIVDLCRDGMRVQARRVPRGVFTVQIADRSTTLYVKAEVVWTRRVGLLRKEHGVRFIDVPADTVSKLALIAQAHSRQPSI